MRIFWVMGRELKRRNCVGAGQFLGQGDTGALEGRGVLKRGTG